MTSNPTDLIRRLADEVDHPRIWLQPPCCEQPDVGRLWCEHDEPVECEDGRPWTEYVRVMPGEPHWWVIRDEDGEIVVGGTREEMEAWWRDQVEDWEAGRRDPANAMISADEEHGYTLHGVYIGPVVEVDG